ncbi:MAG: Fic family protein, partial [Candidatus Sericytochromatia bacterium]
GQVPDKSEGVQAEASVNDVLTTLLLALEDPVSRKELQTKLALSHRDHFSETYLNPALSQGLIEMTLPDKPRSSKQKYRLTTQGKALQAQLKESQHD